MGCLHNATEIIAATVAQRQQVLMKRRDATIFIQARARRFLAIRRVKSKRAALMAGPGTVEHRPPLLGMATAANLSQYLDAPAVPPPPSAPLPETPSAAAVTRASDLGAGVGLEMTLAPPRYDAAPTSLETTLPTVTEEAEEEPVEATPPATAPEFTDKVTAPAPAAPEAEMAPAPAVGGVAGALAAPLPPDLGSIKPPTDEKKDEPTRETAAPAATPVSAEAVAATKATTEASANAQALAPAQEEAAVPATSPAAVESVPPQELLPPLEAPSRAPPFTEAVTAAPASTAAPSASAAAEPPAPLLAPAAAPPPPPAPPAPGVANILSAPAGAPAALPSSAEVAQGMTQLPPPPPVLPAAEEAAKASALEAAAKAAAAEEEEASKAAAAKAAAAVEAARAEGEAAAAAALARAMEAEARAAAAEARAAAAEERARQAEVKAITASEEAAAAAATLLASSPLPPVVPADASPTTSGALLAGAAPAVAAAAGTGGAALAKTSAEGGLPVPPPEAPAEVAAPTAEAAAAAEAERLAAEAAEVERLAAEVAAAAAAEAEAAEVERLAAEADAAAEAERLAAEAAEVERLAAEAAAAAAAEAEASEVERLAAEAEAAAEAERLAAEAAAAAEAERLAAEKAEAERLEAEKAEAERLEAEKAEAERLEAERLEELRNAPWKGVDSNRLRGALRDFLADSSKRVMDLFHEWDGDNSGEIDVLEFRQAVLALGFEADATAIDAVFAELDVDGTGSIEYEELNTLLKVSAETLQARKAARDRAARQAKAASFTTLQLVQGGPSVVEQILELLASKAARVSDLFKLWDLDGNGYIDRDEFHRAFSALGYAAPQVDIDAVFDQMDGDGSGSIRYTELREFVGTKTRGPAAKKALADKRAEKKVERAAAKAAAKAAAAEEEAARAAAAAKLLPLASLLLEMDEPEDGGDDGRACRVTLRIEPMLAATTAAEASTAAVDVEFETVVAAATPPLQLLAGRIQRLAPSRKSEVIDVLKESGMSARELKQLLENVLKAAQREHKASEGGAASALQARIRGRNARAGKLPPPPMREPLVLAPGEHDAFVSAWLEEGLPYDPKEVSGQLRSATARVHTLQMSMTKQVSQMHKLKRQLESAQRGKREMRFELTKHLRASEATLQTPADPWQAQLEKLVFSGAKETLRREQEKLQAVLNEQLAFDNTAQARQEREWLLRMAAKARLEAAEAEERALRSRAQWAESRKLHTARSIEALEVARKKKEKARLAAEATAREHFERTRLADDQFQRMRSSSLGRSSSKPILTPITSSSLPVLTQATLTRSQSLKLLPPEARGQYQRPPKRPDGPFSPSMLRARWNRLRDAASAHAVVLEPHLFRGAPDWSARLEAHDADAVQRRERHDQHYLPPIASRLVPSPDGRRALLLPLLPPVIPPVAAGFIAEEEADVDAAAAAAADELAAAEAELQAAQSALLAADDVETEEMDPYDMAAARVQSTVRGNATRRALRASS